MGEVVTLYKGDDGPVEVDLASEIHRVIDTMATGELTYAEVQGVLMEVIRDMQDEVRGL